MAHGLRKIAGTQGYVPDGSGRDWIFLGDLGYRKGKQAYDSSLNPIRKPGPKPGLQNRSPPAEVALQRSLHAPGPIKMRAARKEKWAKCQEEGKAPVPRCRSLPSYFQTTYSGHGRIPGWKTSPAETPISLMGKQPPPPRPNSAGHLGLGLDEPHFKSTYTDLGNGFSTSKWGAPSPHNLYSLPVFPDVAKSGPPHTLYLGDPLPYLAESAKTHFESTYSQLGRVPGWDHAGKEVEVGAPAKFHHHSVVGVSCFK